jgi:hypothetical protein
MNFSLRAGRLLEPAALVAMAGQIDSHGLASHLRIALRSTMAI